MSEKPPIPSDSQILIYKSDSGETESHGCVLTPGRYVGAEEIEDDGVPFEEKMSEQSTTLYEQFAQADQLESSIKKNLETLGYGE